MPRTLPNWEQKRRVILPNKQVGKPIKSGSLSCVRWVDVDCIEALHFEACREFFHEDSHAIRYMLLAHRKNCGQNIAAFIHQIEKKLKVQPRSCFGPTQRNTILWIWASPWWTSTSMKRSLFTALLRAGQAYNSEEGNLDDTLNSYIYLRDTFYAVKRFLRGYTKYTGRRSGWYTQFRWGAGTWRKPCRPSEERVRKLLVKPD